MISKINEWSKSIITKNINDIASNMASIAFEQWKHSPGHNKNMLGKRHQVHGLAFYLNKDLNNVWICNVKPGYLIKLRKEFEC